MEWEHEHQRRLCNGRVYNRCTHCCENDTIVAKVSLWICERALGGLTTGPVIADYCLSWLTPYFLDFQHTYVCCDGPNLKCFGKQAKRPDETPTVGGDPIAREMVANGDCKMRMVCPQLKAAKCVNPSCPYDYSLLWHNCHDWAWRGVK